MSKRAYNRTIPAWTMINEGFRLARSDSAAPPGIDLKSIFPELRIPLLDPITIHMDSNRYD